MYVFSKTIEALSISSILSPEPTPKLPLMSIFLPTISSEQSRVLQLSTSKFFQLIPITPFQSYFHIFKYQLQQHYTSCYGNLYWFPPADRTKYCKLGDLKQHRFILSQSWRLEIQSQGVGRTMHSLELLEEPPPYPFYLLATPDIIWLEAMSLQFLPLSSHGHFLSMPM